jgi:hypothetical protein
MARCSVEWTSHHSLQAFLKTLVAAAKTVHGRHRFVQVVGAGVVDYQWSVFVVFFQSERILIQVEVVELDIDGLARIKMGLLKMNLRDLCTLSPEFVEQ